MVQKINLTVQRRAILEVVKEADDHPTAADIIQRLREKGFSFAYGTVYNSLRYLADVELIRELKLGEAVSRYDARTEEHQHIVCTVCGKVEEVLVDIPTEWLAQIAEQTKYSINQPHIVMEGMCEQCTTK
ncbi:MAG TPA: transcriptional repressor [Candidatus Paenibacillus intestinavium]|nr:transcriptional repressor [Candidatus Paenibacillus intestinavium]